VQRPDDTEDTVAKRLAVFETQTRPLVGYYEARGVLRRVDANAALEQVTERVEAALG
jgi:adenylate kinase